MQLWMKKMLLFLILFIKCKLEDKGRSAEGTVHQDTRSGLNEQ